MTERESLDRQMRDVLLDLAVCSHARTQTFDATGRSGATDSVILSGGDRGASPWAELYGPPFHEGRVGRGATALAHDLKLPAPASTDSGRRLVLKATRAELERIRGGSRSAEMRPAGETVAERDRRVVADGQGMSPEDAAYHFRLEGGERQARRIRIAAQRYPEDGTPIAGDLTTDQKRDRAREMRTRKVPLREIAAALEVSHMKVARWTRDIDPSNDRRAA
jgi:hypothetical protein